MVSCLCWWSVSRASAEELLYRHALSLAKEGAVKELLGQFGQGHELYSQAKLLMEALLAEPMLPDEDQRILEGYVRTTSIPHPGPPPPGWRACAGSRTHAPVCPCLRLLLPPCCWSAWLLQVHEGVRLSPGGARQQAAEQQQQQRGDCLGPCPLDHPVDLFSGARHSVNDEHMTILLRIESEKKKIKRGATGRQGDSSHAQQTQPRPILYSSRRAAFVAFTDVSSCGV